MHISRVNKIVKKLRSDVDFRVRATLSMSFFWNAIYALFQFVLGWLHSTFWFTSFGIYYSMLAIMRLVWMRNKNPKTTAKKYAACGWVLLAMNIALSLIVFFMIYWDRTFQHHEITTLALATYTFTSLSFAIYGFVKNRKNKRLDVSAIKNINLAAASVSMLVLESTMLSVFDDGSMTQDGRNILLGCTGVAISILLVSLAITMIRRKKNS